MSCVKLPHIHVYILEVIMLIMGGGKLFTIQRSQPILFFLGSGQPKWRDPPPFKHFV